MIHLSAAEKADLIAAAHALADAASVETLRHFRSPGLSLKNKSTTGYDPVTAADRGAERAMRSVLLDRRPSDSVLGEEFPAVEGTTGLTWVIDPIDGTRGYISGTPTWGTLIAVGPDSGPILGIIDQPYIGERFIGGLGKARLIRAAGEIELAARETSSLSDAVLFTTFPEVGEKAEAEAFHRLAGKVKLTRYGMDCYAYALLAMGQVDLVVEAGLKAYDIQAPMAVIQAAGGIVTDWSGGPAHQGGQVIAAANAPLHRAALRFLAAKA